MPLRRLLTSGGGGGSSFSPMFPLNGIVSCKWDSVNNKPDILEIDSVDTTKVNLKATDFPIMLNFANGLDEYNNPSGLSKSFLSNQALDMSGSANKTVQIVEKLLNENSDPTIELVDCANPAWWSAVDIMPAMAAASQDGYSVSSTSEQAGYEAWKVFDDNSGTEWRVSATGYKDILVTLPVGIVLNKVYFNGFDNSGIRLRGINGVPAQGGDVVLWSGDQSFSTYDGVFYKEIPGTLNQCFSQFRIKMKMDYTTIGIYHIRLYDRPLMKYNESENKVYYNDGSDFVAGLKIPLGHAVVNGSGEATSLVTYHTQPFWGIATE